MATPNVGACGNSGGGGGGGGEGGGGRGEGGPVIGSLGNR